MSRTELKARAPDAKALALVVVLLGVGLAAASWWWWRPRPPLAASGMPPPMAREVAREVERQCAAPERIRANLNQRRTQFTQRLQAEAVAPHANATPAPLDAERDPLGALIAASRQGPVAGCAQLEQELRLQWQRAEQRTPQTGPPGRMPPENRRPAAMPPTPTRQP